LTQQTLPPERTVEQACHAIARGTKAGQGSLRLDLRRGKEPWLLEHLPHGLRWGC